MGSITLTIRGEEVEYDTKDTVECQNCGEDILNEAIDGDTCPNCEDEAEWVKVAEEVEVQKRSMWEGSESIEEMIRNLKDKSLLLQELKAEGFSLIEPVYAQNVTLKREC